MKHLKGTKLRLVAVTAGAMALSVAAVAWATPTPIPVSENDVLVLDAEGDAHFDVSQPPDNYNDDCALGDLGGFEEDDLGFSPGNDVTADGGSTDAFDGGLVLAVGSQIFEDSDQTGDLIGEQLTVGPEKLGGLRVKRVETALPGSPTLRSLIKFKNKNKRKAKRRTVSWDSDFGSDAADFVVGSSSGDTALTEADRWVVEGDDDETPVDALPTLVLYGKGKGVKKTRVVDGIADQNGCARFEINVRVPKKSSRYLLFFTEVHDDVELASAEAAKFNKKKPGGGVLDGLKKSVKKKVLNWDLVKN
jgi:hypothetical protein